MKKKTAYVIIGLLILLNIFALYKVKSANNIVNRTEKNSRENKYIANTIKNEERSILNGEEIISKIVVDKGIKFQSITDPPANKATSGIVIYFLYRGHDCTSCIEQTWQMLKKLKKNHTLKIKIKSFFYENDGVSLKTLHKYHEIDTSNVIKLNYNGILNASKITLTPLVLIKDSNSNRVLDAYQPVPNDYMRRAAFRKKWNNILDSI